ncbi:hypothetical protein [Kribbella sp. NPDC003557]|uniref:hypothetical protein n=1 Tax=Kribbella sp. NPDC003557 TaxID=3154449 RepID=UPI0033A26B19
MVEKVLIREYGDRLAGLLGEPTMVGDPLITTAQAAVLLGVPLRRVAGLVRAGHLPARSRARRRLLLSDVAQAGVDRWMSITEAGVVLGLGNTGVRRMITVGLLAARGEGFPLRRDDVEALARRRDGWLSLASAAMELRIDVMDVHQMLRDGTLTHTSDVSRPVYRGELIEVLRTASGIRCTPA